MVSVKCEMERCDNNYRGYCQREMITIVRKPYEPHCENYEKV